MSNSYLIDYLTNLGNEQDAYLAANPWEAINDPVRKAMAKRARIFDPDVGANFDVKEILLTLPEELRGQFTVAWERAKPLCESPIEIMILPWLIGQPYVGFDLNPATLLPGESAAYVPFTVAVIPQLTIGKFRVDFALAASRRDKKIRFVVVECDGAKFHDGTANVLKDAGRDAQILSHGRVLDVVRLNGKRIMRDPAGAAKVAAEAVRWAWSVKNEEVAHKFEVKAP